MSSREKGRGRDVTRLGREEVSLRGGGTVGGGGPAYASHQVFRRRGGDTEVSFSKGGA